MILTKTKLHWLKFLMTRGGHGATDDGFIAGELVICRGQREEMQKDKATQGAAKEIQRELVSNLEGVNANVSKKKGFTAAQIQLLLQFYEVEKKEATQ